MVISFLILCLVPFSDGNCFQNHKYGKQTKDYKLEGFPIQAGLARGIFTCFHYAWDMKNVNQLILIATLVCVS